MRRFGFGGAAASWWCIKGKSPRSSSRRTTKNKFPSLPFSCRKPPSQPREARESWHNAKRCLSNRTRSPSSGAIITVAVSSRHRRARVSDVRRLVQEPEYVCRLAARAFGRARARRTVFFCGGEAGAAMGRSRMDPRRRFPHRWCRFLRRRTCRSPRRRSCRSPRGLLCKAQCQRQRHFLRRQSCRFQRGGWRRDGTCLEVSNGSSAARLLKNLRPLTCMHACMLLA